MRPVDRGKVPVPERRPIGISLSGWDSGDGQRRRGWKGSVPGLEGAKAWDAQRGTRSERRRATEVSAKLFYPGGWAEPPTEEEEELRTAAAAITSQAGKSCSCLEAAEDPRGLHWQPDAGGNHEATGVFGR